MTIAAGDPVIDDVIAMLSGVSGIRAIAIGGSRAIGTADPQSDYDIVVFQQQEGDIDEEALRAAVERVSDGPTKITKKLALAELSIRGHKVELLFRRLNAIASEIENARRGQFRKVLHPLHPAGYITTVLVAHLVYARPVWDPEGLVARLMKETDPYPEILRERMMAMFRNEATLGLIHASKVRRPDDLAYLSALYARVVASWSLFLFAANRRYPVIDKGGLRLVMTFPLHPENFHGRTVKLFRDIAADHLPQGREDAWRLHREVVGTK